MAQYQAHGADSMTLEQQQSADAQVCYSPEEAVEILRLAANLQDSTFTVEQLRAIAREAGVADESLERAIQYHEQNRRTQAQLAERAAVRKRWFRVGLWVSVAALLAAVALLGVRVFSSSSETAYYPALVASEFGLESLLASSPACGVYKVRYTDDKHFAYGREQVIIRHSNGRAYSAGFFDHIATASIALSGRYVALYDSRAGEVCVVSVEGYTSDLVGRIGSPIRLGDGNEGEIAHDDPIAGWQTRDGADILQVRLRNGDVANIMVSAD